MTKSIYTCDKWCPGIRSILIANFFLDRFSVISAAAPVWGKMCKFIDSWYKLDKKKQLSMCRYFK